MMNEKTERKTKILAINFGGIGDEILFFPTLKTIKAFYPSSNLTLVAEPRSASAKNLSNLIDDVITCDIKGKHKYLDIIKFLFKVWTKKYDIAVSSGSSKFVSILLFLTGIKKRVGYDSGPLSRILLSEAVPLNKSQYAANMYHDLAKAIDNEHGCGMPEVDVQPENLLWANEQIGRREKQIITIHPGVSKMSIDKNIFKFWSAQNWVELIIRLLNTEKYKVMIVGGPDDESVLLQIKAELARQDISQENLINLYGQTKNISQLAGLISLSNMLVCVDSAPMHIAVGTRTPVVAIFGPTDENKLLPANDLRFKAVRNTGLECRPCLWGKRQISCEEPVCLDISQDDVLQAIEQQLG